MGTINKVIYVIYKMVLFLEMPFEGLLKSIW